MPAQPVHLTAARRAIDSFRDATREGRRIDFRERDELVMILHEALDELAARRAGGDPNAD